MSRKLTQTIFMLDAGLLIVASILYLLGKYNAASNIIILVYVLLLLGTVSFILNTNEK